MPISVPAKKTELTRPSWLVVRPNSSLMEGRTALRIPASTEVIKMARDVMARMPQETGWARGTHDSRAEGFEPLGPGTGVGDVDVDMVRSGT